MSLESLTQITEVGIKSGITLRNINVEGAYISGVVTATTLTTTGGGASFAGVITATSFYGDGSALTGIVGSGSGVITATTFVGELTGTVSNVTTNANLRTL